MVFEVCSGFFFLILAFSLFCRSVSSSIQAFLSLLIFRSHLYTGDTINIYDTILCTSILAAVHEATPALD